MVLINIVTDEEIIVAKEDCLIKEEIHIIFHAEHCDCTGRWQNLDVFSDQRLDRGSTSTFLATISSGSMGRSGGDVGFISIAYGIFLSLQHNLSGKTN